MLSGQWFIEATFRIQLRFLNHFLLWLKFRDDSLKTASIPRNFIVLHLEKILEYCFTFFWIIFSVIKVLSDFLEHDFFFVNLLDVFVIFPVQRSKSNSFEISWNWFLFVGLLFNCQKWGTVFFSFGQFIQVNLSENEIESTGLTNKNVQRTERNWNYQSKYQQTQEILLLFANYVWCRCY